MINIQKIREFVENGGRFRVGENPVWGEPYYGEYMARYVQEQFAPGDKVDVIIQCPQAKSSEARQYTATILRIKKGSIELLKQGNSVWKDRKNYDNFFYGHVKFISLIKRNIDFDIEKVDPQGEEWRRHFRKEQEKQGEKPYSCELKYRENLKEACKRLYPNQSFDDSVVLNLNFSIYFPWQMDKVEAEVHVDHKNKSVKVAGKTGKPYPNRNVIGFYNDKDVVFGPSALVMLPKDDYIGAFVTCKWAITCNNKVYNFISMVELADFEPVNGEKNVYCIGEKLCPLACLDGEYRSTRYHIYEKLMDATAVFYLHEETEDIFVIRMPESENALQLYGIQANFVFNGYNLQSMVNKLCGKSGQMDTRWNPEVWVTQCKAVPEYANNHSYWQYNKKYDWIG